MALALAYDEAKKNQHRKEGKARNRTLGVLVTPFFGSWANPTPDLPHAHMGQPDAGRTNRAHFHIHDQFQVVVDGKGRIGRHDLVPYSIHFARAYTPYGPLVPDTVTPMTLFTMRAHYDPGSQEVDKLKEVPNRQPWQITRLATFPAVPTGTAGANIMLQEVPGMKDEQGLAAYTLSMKPNAQAYAPDPSFGDGQYLIVVKGSLLHDNKEHKAWALVFVYPKESPFQIHAGPGGLEALVLNFPRPQARAEGATRSAPTKTGLKTWQCGLCAFVYDEAAGLPEEGIAPGTRWQDVPETWNCPDCSAAKSDFQMSELQN